MQLERKVVKREYAVRTTRCIAVNKTSCLTHFVSKLGNVRHQLHLAASDDTYYARCSAGVLLHHKRRHVKTTDPSFRVSQILRDEYRI